MSREIALPSREIKFKYYWQHQKSKDWLVIPYTLGEIGNGDPYDDMSDSPMLRPFELIERRQYTGVKDKDKEELYDGDAFIYDDQLYIIKYVEAFLTYCPFTPLELKWYEEGSNHFKYALAGEEYTAGKPYFLFQFEQYEIKRVGSTYENPEVKEVM